MARCTVPDFAVSCQATHSISKWRNSTVWVLIFSSLNQMRSVSSKQYRDERVMHHRWMHDSSRVCNSAAHELP
jgi:hypothetical protein